MTKTMILLHSEIDEIKKSITQKQLDHLHWVLDAAFNAGRWIALSQVAEESAKKLKEGLEA